MYCEFFFWTSAEQEKAKANKTLKSAPIEDDKRDLINREIGKFRKTAEADEQKKEKEKDRKKRQEEREREKARGSASPRKVKFNFNYIIIQNMVKYFYRFVYAGEG